MNLYGIVLPNNTKEVYLSKREYTSKVISDLKTTYSRVKNLNKSSHKYITFQQSKDISSFRIKKLDVSNRKLKFIDGIAYEYIEDFKTNRKIVKEGKFFVVYSKDENILFRHTDSRLAKDTLLSLSVDLL